MSASEVPALVSDTVAQVPARLRAVPAGMAERLRSVIDVVVEHPVASATTAIALGVLAGLLVPMDDRERSKLAAIYEKIVAEVVASAR